MIRRWLVLVVLLCPGCVVRNHVVHPDSIPGRADTEWTIHSLPQGAAAQGNAAQENAEEGDRASDPSLK